MEAALNIVDTVVRALVSMPEAVRLEHKSDDRGILITIFVDPADMGKIIGKEGNLANSLRTLVRAVGIKNNAVVSMKIFDPKAKDNGFIPRDKDLVS